MNLTNPWKSVKFLNMFYVFVLVTLCAYIFMPRGMVLKISEQDLLFTLLEDGDIICRLANRSWSNYFRNISEEDTRFSYVGIIRIYDNKITVIHSEGSTLAGTDNVLEEPLEEFISVARSLGVYRLKNEDRAKISSAAMSYLGVPFDWQFDMNDSSRLYCTELIYTVLKDVDLIVELPTIYLGRHNIEAIPLEAISNSDYFYEVYFIGNQQVADNR